MLDKDIQGMTDRFMEKLQACGFTVTRSQNDAEDYDIEKQERDSKATDEFTKSQLFKDIIENK